MDTNYPQWIADLLLAAYGREEERDLEATSYNCMGKINLQQSETALISRILLPTTALTLTDVRVTANVI